MPTIRPHALVRPFVPVLALVPLLALPLAGPAGAQCPRQWSEAFVGGDFDGPIQVIREWNGDLYVGGDFTRAGGQPAVGLARWDGVSWSEVGGGVLPVSSFRVVTDLAVFDDGSGEALYVAGSFVEAGGLPIANLARWDGSVWSSLGQAGSINALLVHDDGTGPALYAGGWFETLAGITAHDIARWDGVAWSAVGGGIMPEGWGVNALCEWHDGTSAVLVAGGDFWMVEGQPAGHVAAWDGVSWSEVGGGTSATVHELATWTPGVDEVLLVGGQFLEAGGLPAGRVAGWDGTAWETFAGGVGPDFIGAQAFATFDDGNGDDLYVGGFFTDAGGLPIERFARWDGVGWSDPGIGVNSRVTVLEVVGSELVLGGTFTRIDGQVMTRIGAWDGVSVHGFDNGDVGNGLSGAAYDFCTVDFDGPGAGAAQTFVVGAFVNAGPTTVNHVARLEDTVWAPVGGGAKGIIYCCASHPVPGGEALAVAGDLSELGGLPAAHVGLWDGASWSDLGGGLTSTGFPPSPAALASWDDGGGRKLYVAGSRFDGAGGTPVHNLAAWNGSAWEDVGGGFPGEWLADLAVHDDGSGEALYAVGGFAMAGSTSASGIARWDGTAWSDVGGSTNGSVGEAVSFDLGGAAQLLIAGTFTEAGGVPADGLARWDGVQWHDASAGFLGAYPELTVLREGAVDVPWASYTETLPDGRRVGTLASWHGSTWSVHPASANGFIRGLGVGVDPLTGGEALYVGGDFLNLDGRSSANIARYECAGAVPAPVAAAASGPGLLRSVSPNPAMEAATIAFTVPRDASVRLTVHDVRGAVVRVVADQPFQAGAHRATWDGRNERGARVAGGVYFLRLDSGERIDTRRLVVLR